MKNQKIYCLIYLSLVFLLDCNRLAAQCNRMLDFDGTDDYIQAASPVSGVIPFTIELKFKSDNTSGGICNASVLTDFRWLLGWDGDGFGIGDCNGQLAIIHAPSCTVSPFVCNLFASPPVINDGQWHCLAIVQNAVEIQIFLDGNLLPTLLTPIPYDLSGNFRLGSSGTGAIGKTWLGQVDEFKIWETARTGMQVADACTCPSASSDPDLLTYWNFDQGISGADNSAITQLDDVSGNNNHGTFSGFTLGNPATTNSNFFCSTGFSIMPYLAGLNIEIKDYPTISTSLTEICSGDPVHFCLLDDEMMSPSPSGNVVVEWQMDDGTGWSNVTAPAFSGYCFTVPPDVITANCGVGSTGFTYIRYRAKFEVNHTSPAYICTMYSDEYTLRVCCPISTATVEVTTDLVGDLLCEQDIVNFTVSLNSPDPFVTSLGPDAHIYWTYNNTPIAFDDQTSFTYPATAVTNPSACFEAKVTNCSKSKVFTKCFTVDLPPSCGAITSMSSPSPFIPDPLGNPDLFYVCPGGDGVLGMVDPALFDGNTTIAQWQYSFTPGDPTSWFNLGTSNALQNTNILPSYYWLAGATEIFYRIIGLPKSTPSGCDPCYSNIINIKFKPPVPVDTIVGMSPICKGAPTTLGVGAFNIDYQYSWFCSGLPVGAGPTFDADQNACYSVEISNGCAGQEVETPPFCLEVCEIVPVISCPQNQNGDICIRLGDDIMLDACSSTDNCVGALTYTWTASNGGTGTTSGLNGCLFAHTPELGGTTYTVTITNMVTGCSTNAQTTIIPCQTP